MSGCHWGPQGGFTPALGLKGCGQPPDEDGRGKLGSARHAGTAGGREAGTCPSSSRPAGRTGVPQLARRSVQAGVSHTRVLPGELSLPSN